MGHFYSGSRPSHRYLILWKVCHYCGNVEATCCQSFFFSLKWHNISLIMLGNSCVLSSHEKKIICSSQKIRTEKWRSGWKRSINNSCCWGATVVQINSEKKVEIFVCNMSYINKILFEYNAIFETDIWIGIWYERFHNHTYLMFVM